MSLLKLALLSLIISCSSLSPKSSIDLEQIYNDHFEWGMKEYPEWATYEGRVETNHLLTDRSFEAFDRRDRYAQELLARLDEIKNSGHLESLTEQDRLNFALFYDQISQSVEGQRFPSHVLVLNQLRGFHTGIARLISQMPKSNGNDLENIRLRLLALPKAIEQHRLLLERGLELKVTPPRAIMGPVEGQLKRLTLAQKEENPIVRALHELPANLPESLSTFHLAEVEAILNTKVLPAFQGFYDYYVTTYYPGLREQTAWTTLPDGQAWYAHMVRAHTTTELGPQEIHEIGLREVERIHGLKRELIGRSEFRGTPEQFRQKLLTDPQFFFDTEEELMIAYQAMAKQVDAVVAQLFLVLPRTPYGVKKMEPHIAASSPAALYFGGNLKTGRSGTFYVNTSNLKSRPKWEMMALTLHEAVPGHHLQIALAQELEDVPEFRKRTGYTAYIEGWGLYAEALGFDLNLYHTPYDEWGMLSFEMWRAVRLVVDTGLHALGWSREQAIEYFINNTGRPASEAQIEIDRYIIWPGQALAYKIGELKIWELRRLALKELGDAFDLREFHHEVLRHGAIPLTILEHKIHEWIAQKKTISAAAS
jgi:uncharacterized protein (DUF885 family)